MNMAFLFESAVFCIGLLFRNLSTNYNSLCRHTKVFIPENIIKRKSTTTKMRKYVFCILLSLNVYFYVFIHIYYIF